MKVTILYISSSPPSSRIRLAASRVPIPRCAASLYRLCPDKLVAKLFKSTSVLMVSWFLYRPSCRMRPWSSSASLSLPSSDSAQAHLPIKRKSSGLSLPATALAKMKYVCGKSRLQWLLFFWLISGNILNRTGCTTSRQACNRSVSLQKLSHSYMY